MWGAMTVLAALSGALGEGAVCTHETALEHALSRQARLDVGPDLAPATSPSLRLFQGNSNSRSDEEPRARPRKERRPEAQSPKGETKDGPAERFAPHEATTPERPGTPPKRP
jgi:hypothetical protein